MKSALTVMLLLLPLLKGAQIMMSFEVPLDQPKVSAYRHMVMNKNLQLIRDHNANPEKTYEMKAYPQFIALTPDELNSKHLMKVSPILHSVQGLRIRNETILQVQRFPFNVKLGSRSTVLSSSSTVRGTIYGIDLSHYSGTVFDQGNCGNCYAYATVCTVHLKDQIQGRGIPFLSVEQLTACSSDPGQFSPTNLGCNGGTLPYSGLYMILKGLVSLQQYPINSNTVTKGVLSSCRSVSGTNYKIKDMYVINSNSCGAQLLKVDGRIPLATVMHFPAQFNFYSQGVFVYCPQGQINHAVTIVGYRADMPIQSDTRQTRAANYFKVKNSYGVGWGVGGYFYITMIGNQCGICTQSTYIL